jgi:fucose permease
VYPVHFLYVIAEISFSLWLPVFMTDRLHLSVADAAFSLVLMWSGFTVGRIVTWFVARRFACYKVIFALTALILLSIILLFTAMTRSTTLISSFSLGLVCRPCFR